MSTEVHQAAETVTTSNELDLQFGPLFDKYFNGENQVVLKSSAVTTTDASNKRQQQPDSTSSTSTLATTVTANGNFDLGSDDGGVVRGVVMLVMAAAVGRCASAGVVDDEGGVFMAVVVWKGVGDEGSEVVWRCCGNSEGGGGSGRKLAGEPLLHLSSSGVTPNSEATLEDLKTKHPFHPAPSLPHILIDHHHLIASSTVVLDKIKSFPCGTSCGQDGLRAQHLMDCLSGVVVVVSGELVSSITQVVNLFLAGNYPLMLGKYIANAPLKPLVKPGGGIRPIAMGTFWRRLVSKLGVGVSGGSEAILHSVNHLIEACGDDVGLSMLLVDFKNAFNLVDQECFILNTKDYLTKFDPKSYEGVFLGYSQNSKAYIILNKHTRKVKESLNVTFDETPPPSKTSPLVDDDLDEEEAIKVTEKKNLENDIEDETLEIDEIVNIKESRNHPLENIVAMQEELNQFIANDVWELVPQPRNMTIIGTKWVFRNKLDENGIVSQNKARLVAQGYNQQEGIDYDETYALVARLESIRILLAYACALDFKLFQMDVKSAFLNGFINEEVYVAQPLGFIDFEKPDHVYKLKKALYGLKQAPKAWYDRLKAFLIKHEYKMGMFEMSMMGELNFFLGLQIKQMEDGIFFNQSKYIKEMLKKFGLEESKPMKTPMSSDTKLTKDKECELVDSTKVSRHDR
ncbi:retrovirus-related pol polyprotein from transposon TNT 1-94 [Tanacetum coccineum]